jgi:hypothetical protein
LVCLATSYTLEEYCLLGYDVMQSATSSYPFRSKVLPLTSEWTNKTEQKQEVGRLQEPEDKCSTFIRNVGKLLSDYTALRARSTSVRTTKSAYYTFARELNIA